MKRVIFTSIILVLILALHVPALTEEYIHPTGGYGFTVPEGWYAVDGNNVEYILVKIVENNDVSDLIRSNLELLKNSPIV